MRPLPASLGWMLLFLCSYALYRVLGMEYEAPLSGMHFLSMQWLQEDLPGTLRYLHAQPPLLNLLAAGATALSPVHYAWLLEAVNIVSLLIALYYMQHTLLLLEAPKRLRQLLLAMFCLSPTSAMMTAWYYAPALEISLVAALTYYAAVFFQQKARATRAAIIVFALSSLLGLLHARWHLLVFLMLAAMMWHTGRRAVMIGLLCLLPLVGWYGKNQLQFGFFGASSWLGLNLTQIAMQLAPQQERQRLVSNSFPILYEQESILRAAPPPSYPPRHPALLALKLNGEPNYNYGGVVDAGRQGLRDSVALVAAYPWRYLRQGSQRFIGVSITPSLSHPQSPGLVQLQRQAGLPEGYDALPLVLRGALSVLSGIVYLAVPLLAVGTALRGEAAHRRFIVAMIYLVMAMMLIACFANGWEQVRMRWSLLPCYFTLCGLVGRQLVKDHSARQPISRRQKPSGQSMASTAS